ncbi:amidohydrolase family protein [Maribacter aestuarii]|uniref:amidohydrolase family protein n=1 Tax=Maribacter aestuarii TaxID=1130723 RepID=UPI0025A5BA2F|nr:amidohydrolase family protein [Maribacter aestuarii]
MKNAKYIIIALVALMACKSEKKQNGSEEAETTSLRQETIKKIDVHAHFKYERDYFKNFFNKWNMQGILVDVSKADSLGIGRSWDEYLILSQAQPDLFFLCTSLIGVGIDAPDFADRQIDRLKHEIEQGARMVKVWKNFGMVTKDASGKFIQIDDERLQPIWDFLEAQKIPVMAHIGEPVQAWRPLDDPNNPHYGYYKNNPEYHAFQHPEIPSYETIIKARDNWISRNPDLKILCAHLGSMSHDVDMVAERLDKFPNMYVETAARFGDLVGQDSDKVSGFFEKYQNRIFFGTDYGNSSPQEGKTEIELEDEEQDLQNDYNRLWTYVSSKDSVAERGQKNIGLGLSEDVLRKIYYENVVNFLELQ